MTGVGFVVHVRPISTAASSTDPQEDWDSLLQLGTATGHFATLRSTGAFTWFVDQRDLLFHSCECPREVRLPDDPGMWEKVLRHLWSDFQNSSAPIAFKTVQSEGQPLNVIVIQNPQGSLASCLLTIQDQVTGFSRQLVVTADDDLPLGQWLRGVGLGQRCVGSNDPCLCHIFVNELPLRPGDPFHARDGHHLLLLLSLRPRLSPHLEMAIDLPGESPEQTQFHLNPEARPFLPVQPLLSQQDEFIQDLHVDWLFNAWAWEDEEPSCVVAVWFIDHRWIHPHGTQYRKVRLWPDFLTWYHALESAWFDQRDPDASLEFHLVQPRPPNEDAEIKLHVLLIQHAREDWVTSLVSFMDMSATPYLAIQLAVTTHELILLDNILRVCRLYEPCTRSHITIFCAAWWGQMPLIMGNPIQGRSGYGILGQYRTTVSVYQSINTAARSTAMSDTEQASSSSHSLLQLSAQLSHAAPRRLTHGQVAHTHGPRQVEEFTREHIECLDSIATLWRLHAVVERADEGRALHVSTWFSDATRWPTCLQSRSVRLLSDPGNWPDALAEVWEDRLDPDRPVAYFLLNPHPRGNLWNPAVQPHVLLVQNPQPHSRSVHIGLLDPQASAGIDGSVRVVPTPTTRAHLLAAVDIPHDRRPFLSGDHEPPSKRPSTRRFVQ